MSKGFINDPNDIFRLNTIFFKYRIFKPFKNYQKPAFSRSTNISVFFSRFQYIFIQYMHAKRNFSSVWSFSAIGQHILTCLPCYNFSPVIDFFSLSFSLVEIGNVPVASHRLENSRISKMCCKKYRMYHGRERFFVSRFLQNDF